jgi:hypothetical protein
LETGGEVRRLADHSALLSVTGADQVADNDEAGGDADAARQRAGAVLQPSDALKRANPARTARSASSSWARG